MLMLVSSHLGFSVDITSSGNWAYTPAAVAVYEAHVSEKPIISPTRCDGTCKATIRAPGYTSMGKITVQEGSTRPSVAVQNMPFQLM